MGRPRPGLVAFLKSVPGLELLDAPDGALLSDAGVTADAGVTTTKVVTTNGAAAFDVSNVDVSSVDVLIFDVYRPDYDDWAVLCAIRSRMPRACCVTLIGSPHQMEGARDAGADRVLLAGFAAAEFFEVLQGLVG